MGWASAPTNVTGEVPAAANAAPARRLPTKLAAPTPAADSATACVSENPFRTTAIWAPTGVALGEPPTVSVHDTTVEVPTAVSSLEARPSLYAPTTLIRTVCPAPIVATRPTPPSERHCAASMTKSPTAVGTVNVSVVTLVNPDLTGVPNGLT